MPLLNLSPVLASPMLQSTFTVLRRQQIVGNNGRASTQNTSVPGLTGIIYPSAKNELERFPNLQITGKALTVITSYPLRSAAETVDGKEWSPDLVQWGGSNFIVRTLEDWSQYSTGFVLAICESITLVDSPPSGGQ